MLRRGCLAGALQSGNYHAPQTFIAVYRAEDCREQERIIIGPYAAKKTARCSRGPFAEAVCQLHSNLGIRFVRPIRDNQPKVSQENVVSFDHSKGVSAHAGM